MNLSQNFTLEEFTYSQNAARAGLSNTPDIETIVRLKRLAAVMEEVRLICGGYPVVVTSGYRCLEVNRLCGGADRSSHTQGLAVDFIIPGYGTPKEICQVLEPEVERLGIDQLIWEFEQWVHLGLKEEGEEPRGHCCTIDRGGFRMGFG